MQARLCPRPLAYGKALTRPIGARHNVALPYPPGLDASAGIVSKDIAHYRKIGLTQLSIPANHIFRYLRPKMAESDLFHRIGLWPIRFDFSESMESQVVLTFQNQWNLKSF
jgi:hypothetical protein